MDKVKYNPEIHKVVYDKTLDIFVFDIEDRLKFGDLDKTHIYELCEPFQFVFPKLREVIESGIEDLWHPDNETIDFYDPEPEKLLVLERLFEEHIKEFVLPYYESVGIEVDFSEV